MKQVTIAVLALLSLALILSGGGALIWATSDTPTEIYVPGAAHVTGANNTNWRTDLELRSVGTIGARVRVDLLRRDRDNTNHPSIILELNAGTAERYDDVLYLLFGYEGSATLRITTLDGEVRATGRTYNDTPDGTYGQFIVGMTATDIYSTGRDATLIQLSASPDLSSGTRANVGLVNLEGVPAEIDIDLYLADLQYLGRVSRQLEAYEFVQIDKIFGRVSPEDVPDGIAISRAKSSGTRYLVYASVIDNLTGDPIFIPGLSNQAGIQPLTPTPTPTGGPPTTPTPTPTATPTPTPTIPIAPVLVRTIDEDVYRLLPASIRFIVGGSTRTSLILCSQDGTLNQVTNSNFKYIQGPTETVEWMDCCPGFGARLSYETSIGTGGSAVARSSCSPGVPYFAISGDDVDTGVPILVTGENLDLALWP